MAIRDLNGDGRVDLAVKHESVDTVSVLFNTTAPGAGTPAFSARADFTAGDAPAAVVLGDLNGDRKPDLVTANRNAGTISVLFNTTAIGATSASFAAKVDFSAGTNASALALGDMNGDGLLDVVTANTYNMFTFGTFSVLRNTTTLGGTTPSFATRVQTDAGVRPGGVALADLDGDGRLDVAVANQGEAMTSAYSNTIAPGATSVSFTAPATLVTDSGPGRIAIRDLNGDGRLDLAVSTSAGASILLRQ